MELFVVLAITTVLIRSIGTKTADVVHAMRGTESERMKKWRQKHGADYQPSGFSRYLDEAWADAAQRTAELRANRARRYDEYGYNPGPAAWAAAWWHDAWARAVERHGDRVEAGRRERGEEYGPEQATDGGELGIVFPDWEPGRPGDVREEGTGSLEDHTVPDPATASQPQSGPERSHFRPNTEFGPTVVDESATSEGATTRRPSGNPMRDLADTVANGTGSADGDLAFAAMAMLFASSRRDDEAAPNSSRSNGAEDIIDAEVVEDGEVHDDANARYRYKVDGWTVYDRALEGKAKEFGGDFNKAEAYFKEHPEELAGVMRLIEAGRKDGAEQVTVTFTSIEAETLSATQNTNINTNEGELMSDVGTVGAAIRFTEGLGTQLTNAASSLEQARADLAAAGVTGQLLTTLTTAQESVSTAFGAVAAAHAEAQNHASTVGQAYAATPGAGDKAYATGE